jgi:serine/threonine protein kinase
MSNINQLEIKISDVFEKDKNSLFEILQELGVGGFGSTYLIKDLTTNRELVAKFPLIRKERDDQYRIRKLKHEAKILKELQDHQIPHIVQFYDTFETFVNGVKVPVFIMEKAQGVTCDELLDSQPDNYIKESFVTKILENIGTALIDIHKYGLIHRDIKPANIFIDGDENDPVITLIDFGIAAFFDQSSSLNKATCVGSPFYSPPEQNAEGVVSPSADVYSLAATGFKLITGRVLAQRGGYQPNLYSKKDNPISERFSDVIEKATWGDMKYRFPLMEDFLNALRGHPPINTLPRIIADGCAYPINRSHIRIGRKNSNLTPPVDIEIEERSQPHQFFISRLHCSISTDDQGYYRLQDEKSTNGTMFLDPNKKWWKVPSRGIILGDQPLVIGLGYADQVTGKLDKFGNEIKPGVYKIIEYRPSDEDASQNK